MSSLRMTVRVRRARPDESDAVVGLLTAALDNLNSPVATWIYGGGHAGERDPHAYLAQMVTDDQSNGFAHVAVHADDIVGAALWDSRQSDDGSRTRPRRSRVTCCGERLRRMQVLAQARRPALPHHRLGLAGVRPDLRRQGIGSALMIAHHSFLYLADLGAYAVCDDGPRRRLLLRHRYSDIGPPQLLPGGIPVWSMWRAPSPANPM